MEEPNANKPEPITFEITSGGVSWKRSGFDRRAGDYPVFATTGGLMAGAFHELENVNEVADNANLTIPRARTLLDAVMRQRDFAVVQLLQHSTDGKPLLECLVVEVECDGVPPKNGYGINYRERLALCVPADSRQLIEVLALRKDFPVMMHQNQGIPGAPASLCLYFEPAATVTRTWTPQSFLRRIQWWLEKSAEGALHPADQPVEHLFFATKYELVLPWNFSELRANPALRFAIARGAERADGGFTCFMENDRTGRSPACSHGSSGRASVSACGARIRGA
jgi:hypothetical protein